MNRKRDEALGFHDDSTDHNSLSGHTHHHGGVKRIRANANQTSEVGSIIDSELLNDEKSQNSSVSNLTSNIDSVYSFYSKK